jgi:hypothetical protein
MRDFHKAYLLRLVAEGGKLYLKKAIWPDSELLAPSQDGPQSFFPNRKSIKVTAGDGSHT